MKKYLKILAFVLFLPLATSGFSDCSGEEDLDDGMDDSGIVKPGDDNDNTGPGDSTVAPPTDTPTPPSGSGVLDPDAQKNKLEQAGILLMQELPYSAFSDLVEFGEFVSNTYSDDDAWDAVYEWAETSYDALLKSTGTVTEEKDPYNSGMYVYTNFYTEYTALLMASNFTGHFSWENNEWVYTEANDLQFSFLDQNSNDCVLKLTTSGTVKKVYVGQNEDWSKWESYTDSLTGVWYGNEYYDRTALTIGVPENITVTLKRGSETTAKLTAKFNLSNIASNNNFDIAKSGLTASASLELSNGFKFNWSQLNYTPNKKAQLAYSIEKSGKSLLSLSLGTDLSGMPSWYLAKVDEMEEENLNSLNGKNAYVNFDVLGKVQLVGTLTDVRRFMERAELADENDDNELQYKSHIGQLNNMLKIYAYYDGNSKEQALVKLECFQEEDWDGYHWEATPVLHFYDGSSYSTFEAFFDEYNFRTLIDTFEKLLDDWGVDYDNVEDFY